MEGLMMDTSALRRTSFFAPLVVAAVLLALVIGVGSAVHPSGVAFLGVMVWLLVLGALATAAFVFIRAQRPVAALGVLLVGVSIAVAFYVSPQPWLAWTVLWFAGVALIVWGTARDTLRRDAWPLLLLRVFIGWAWVDNAQDHFWASQWFGGTGGQYAQVANGAVSRPPLYFADPLYQGFLRGVVVPNVDLWASLTACGELTIGILLAIGFVTPVAAFLSLWQSSNYILMKGFLAHGAYTDKVFWIAALVLLVTHAGQVYGLDAMLRRYVPAWFATWFLGHPPEASPTSRGAVPVRQPQPA
jgi:uncharacterized membrane protein YphA (DoxX/SURF4 family)